MYTFRLQAKYLFHQWLSGKCFSAPFPAPCPPFLSYRRSTQRSATLNPLQVEAALTRLKLGGTVAAATLEETRRNDEEVVAGAENETGGRDGTTAGLGGAPESSATTAIAPCGWRLEHIETFKLLSGGQAEVTIVGRAAGGTPEVGVAPAAAGGE